MGEFKGKVKVKSKGK